MGARTLIAKAVVTAVVVLAAVALFAAASGPGGKPTGTQSQSGPGSSQGQPAILGGNRRGLLKLDPRTLKPLPGRAVPRGGLFLRAWSLSRDHSKLVFGPEPGPAKLRFVDLERMRLFADDLRLAPRGAVVAAAWPATRRALAVTEGSCCRVGATLHVVDPVAGRVVARRSLHRSIQGIARFRNGLVLLLGPGQSVGTSRLAVINARGGVRSVSLPHTRSAHGRPGEERYPGLALDPDRGRAFVVGAGEPVAEVDLDRMRVYSHELSEPVSLFGRLRDWLEPEAQADFAPEGPIRQALWLGEDRIAVSGSDSRYLDGHYRRFASGLQLIDTRSWTVSTLDERVMKIALAADTLLAWGPVRSDPEPPIGLTGYDLEGERRFHLFAGREVYPSAIVGTRTYVHVGRWSWPEVNVVDLKAGRVLGRRALKWRVFDAKRDSPSLPWLPQP
jgi:hypothetical protein